MKNSENKKNAIKLRLNKMHLENRSEFLFHANLKKE